MVFDEIDINKRNFFKSGFEKELKFVFENISEEGSNP